MDYLWAEKFPELFKVLKLFQFSEVSNPLKYHYKPTESILQDGPQCGLVALAMCTIGNQINNLQSIFESAKKQHFTYNGEIFSVQYMETLAKQFLNNSEVSIYEESLDCEKIKEFLLDGGIILVPYDTNKDNSPGFHRGHKAHWALITGGILATSGFFVTARHGKAKNVAVWDLKTLAHSNLQLHEFSPDRKLQDIEYKLPNGGIDGSLGLNGKSVLIKFV